MSFSRLSTRVAAAAKPLARSFSTQKAPVKVAVTGPAGQIGYATLFRIASGAMLGPDQPVILQLIDLPFAENALEAVKMELNDCAFPLLHGVTTNIDQAQGFKDANYALLVGSKPRGPGMDRADLLKDNGAIFVDTGKAINDNAARDLRALVVGNPANTNCLILAANSPSLPKESFHAMTRLDHDRALHQLSAKLGVATQNISKFCIWGNHSSTMYPDTTHAVADHKAVTPQIEQSWIDGTFIPTVQERGAAIIKARGLSSAASAGNAAIAHVRDWATGTNGEWASFSVPSDGSYDVPEGLVFSYPVVVENGEYQIVQGLDISPEVRKGIENTARELSEERDAVSHLL